jgi:hypothetical protein
MKFRSTSVLFIVRAYVFITDRGSTCFSPFIFTILLLTLRAFRFVLFGLISFPLVNLFFDFFFSLHSSFPLCMLMHGNSLPRPLCHHAMHLPQPTFSTTQPHKANQQVQDHKIFAITNPCWKIRRFRFEFISSLQPSCPLCMFVPGNSPLRPLCHHAMHLQLRQFFPHPTF